MPEIAVRVGPTTLLFLADTWEIDPQGVHLFIKDQATLQDVEVCVMRTWDAIFLTQYQS
jgi:hypothetical protein